MNSRGFSIDIVDLILKYGDHFKDKITMNRKTTLLAIKQLAKIRSKLGFR